MAVADVDRKRLQWGKEWIEQQYAKKTGKSNYVDVKVYDDYHDLIANPEIDAVVISTPDHWHAQPAMEAALAGKHIYLQKPTSLTVREGRQMADAVRKSGVVFQLGSQQRSVHPWPQFKRTCELVRNGRIGQLKKFMWVYRATRQGETPNGCLFPKISIMIFGWAPRRKCTIRWIGYTPKPTSTSVPDGYAVNNSVQG